MCYHRPEEMTAKEFMEAVHYIEEDTKIKAQPYFTIQKKIEEAQQISFFFNDENKKKKEQAPAESRIQGTTILTIGEAISTLKIFNSPSEPPAQSLEEPKKLGCKKK